MINVSPVESILHVLQFFKLLFVGFLVGIPEAIVLFILIAAVAGAKGGKYVAPPERIELIFPSGEVERDHIFIGTRTCVAPTIGTNRQ